MADLASSLTRPVGRSEKQDGRWVAGALLLIVTIAVRWHSFGDPNYHIDEGFYLLVGERMHDGLLPYVDIWDRKPFGLFVLYWLVTAFGDVHAYQIAAGLCVWLTAWTIATIAGRHHARAAAITCGAISIVALEVLAGGGGQSPVFYNLPMALAALFTLDSLTSPQSPYRKGIAAMLLCGLALTIKPTALFEGVFFGLVLSYRVYRTGGWQSLAAAVPAFMLAAIMPTALCFGFFAMLGHGALYFDATVTSIFATLPADSGDEADRIRRLLFVLLPLTVIALAGLALCLQRAARGPYALFIAGWLVAALAGFMAVPNYFDHYALPLVPVLATTAAATLSLRIIGPTAAVVVTGWMLLVAGYPQAERTQRSVASVARAAALIAPNLGDGCLFAYDSPAILYRASKSCLPTSRLFSEHLSNAREAKAIGLDPVKEVERILSNRPPVIAIAARPTLNTPNKETLAIMRRTLNADYALLDTVKLRDIVSSKPVEIWVRKP